MTMQGRRTIRRRILGWEEDLRIKLLSKIHRAEGTVSLAADGWSSRHFRSYLIVTTHWIDTNREMNSATLAFLRYQTSHSGDKFSKTLLEALQVWDLKKK